MTYLALSLFGAFHASLGGVAVDTFGSTKAQSLLVYLALRPDRPHARTSLATLLWPDDEERAANNNLRQALYLLRKAIRDAEQDPPILLSTRQTIRFNAASDSNVDVLEFMHHLQAGKVAAALDLYQGDLLAGFDSNSRAFDEWLVNEREHLHNLALDGLRQLGEQAFAEGNFEEGISAARRQLEMEPWHEAAHQLLMRGLATNGDRAGALTQYHRCRQILRQELDIAPSAGMERLYAEIRSGTMPAAPLATARRVTHDDQVEQSHMQSQEIEPPTSVVPPQPHAQTMNWIVAGEEWQTHELSHGQDLTLAPPSAPTRPPDIPDFVGRDAELAYYAEKLASGNLAVICGMAGVGKTALAVALAQQLAARDEQVLWHSFNAGEGVETVLWKLAAFLARHGQVEMWTLLQRTQLTGGQPPPTDTMVDYVVEATRGGEYLFCFDDYHHVDVDANLNQLVQRLVANHQTRGGVIITARRRPPFVRTSDFAALGGLNTRDARGLVRHMNAKLTEEQFETLYASTAGNAIFLTLALATLTQSSNPDELIASLVRAADIENYLLHEVDDHLSVEERAVMAALAVLLGYAGSRDLVEEMTGGNVYRALRTLTARHLLIGQTATMQTGERVRTYVQHDIVRAFYYRQLSRRQRTELHATAAAFYAEQGDRLGAALHYERAGRHDAAATLLLQDIWSIVNAGDAERLQTLLEALSAALGAGETAIQINLARGELHAFAGDAAQARVHYENALHSLPAQPDSISQQVLYARACHGLGKAQRRDDPKNALEWMERGLEVLRDLDSRVKAQILIDIGSLELITGVYADAIAMLEAGLALAETDQDHLRLFGLSELASVYLWMGEAQRSQEVVQDALVLARRLGDRIAEQTLLLNHGILQSQLGDLQSARVCLEGALASARTFGNIHATVITLITLGVVHMRTGEYGRAEAYLLEAKEIAEASDHAVGMVMVLNNLGESAVQQEDWQKALEYTDRAYGDTLRLGLEQGRAYVLDTMAQAYLGLGRHTDALAAIKEALAIADRLADRQIEAFASLNYGQILAATGNRDEAQSVLRRSVQLSAAVDQQSYAKSKLTLGRLLIEDGDMEGGDIEEGQTLVEEAQRIFIQMGATYWADLTDETLIGLDAH